MKYLLLLLALSGCSTYQHYDCYETSEQNLLSCKQQTNYQLMHRKVFINCEQYDKHEWCFK